MITAGIDMGAQTIKVVVMEGREILGRAMNTLRHDPAGIARSVLEHALGDAGVGRAEVERVAVTGAGRDQAPGHDRSLTEVDCAARAAVFLCPEVRTVVEVGAEGARAIRLDRQGRVVDATINERCAAGAGSFADAMARLLECRIDELGPLSLESTRAIPIQADCVVFAESDLVAMLHDGVARPDLARAVNDAIAARLVAMVRRVGSAPPLMLIGGLARNVGLVASLARGLEIDQVRTPDHPDYCGALGAALGAGALAAGLDRSGGG